MDNRKLFLSKRAIQSFGGYADAQLRRLQNALARDSFPQTEKEQHIFNSVKNAMHDFNTRYKHFDQGSMEIFIDKAINPELETEIFVNANMTHYPLRDYTAMWSTMANVVKDYEKIGKRNKKKDDLHLNKHAMHLIRLFLMALDILEEGEIRTFREKEHDLLMDIRFGKYQKSLQNDIFDDLIKQVVNLNTEICSDDSLGSGFCIGHSYFCGQEECTEEWMKSVVYYEILPMLNEYWFDDKKKVQRWKNIFDGVFNG